MGILIDICMLFTLLASLQQLPFKHPVFIKAQETVFIRAQRTISRYAVLIVLVSLWNVLWYAPQNFTTFWGQMAFASGISTLLTLMPMIRCHQLPKRLRTQKVHDFLLQFKWMESDWKYTMIRLVLFDCIVQHTWTIVVLNN